MDNLSKAFITAVLAKYFVKNRRPKNRAEIETTIYNNVLNEKDRKILHRRLIDGLTLEELAEEFNFSVPGIKKKIRKYKGII